MTTNAMLIDSVIACHLSKYDAYLLYLLMWHVHTVLSATVFLAVVPTLYLLGSGVNGRIRRSAAQDYLTCGTQELS